ncbi:quinoprotein dehydrogenase-associated putative ABC transporter substrate-binding protein [Carboxydochorda subterranea]|uniref:Quinoprotein dehydrogenase-associated putative ABC transporter substrate-binding protein n=1 Tax=Carboxydichorda subterranea TaxID=3109565 RepID=A0ABZ1BX44_9FIRM|nr:quinoprotein dehydrogenase-associated putative ABC transporter substrate-binding protein [Limnochorda sp. L945t]WRP17352.1 quinoprotein dehydrogenase-associated putative ABC transporter substrate-binding protein [Limnochorda sp. L945t]
MTLARRTLLMAAAGLTIVSAIVGGLGARSPSSAPARRRWELKVCADPNNLPYSNQKLQGFENRIAALVADELHATLAYEWWPQRRGAVRDTLREGSCDVIMGVPDGYPLALTTEPYYRSSYVFVYRADRGVHVRSFDDPVLKELRIGIQMIGDDYANSPPAHALANRGIVDQVRGYSVYGDYDSPAPLSPIVDAVVKGEVDVAVVWGPIAGYFARHAPVKLELVPVSPEIEPPFLPMVYSISMGVRQGDEDLKTLLDGVIERRYRDIQRILHEYGVPTLPVPGMDQESEASPSATDPQRAELGQPSADTLALWELLAPAVKAAAPQHQTAEGSKKLNPYTGNPEAIAEGKKLFMKWGCYGCHGTGGGGGMGPSLIDTQWIYGGDDATVFKTIKEGRPNGMPAWGSHLKDDEIWEIMAYIRSLYRGDPKAVNW